MEYIKFAKRDFGWNGDRGTWARRNGDGSISVKRARKGLISEGYAQEMREFCAKHGQNFSAIRTGETITFRDTEIDYPC